MALVNYGNSDDSSESEDESPSQNLKMANPIKHNDNGHIFTDSVENEYKMRIPKNAKPVLTPFNIEKKRSGSGKVLLSFPTLEELDSSDESENDECGAHLGVNKTAKSAKKPQGKSLLDLLPPTRALIVREGNIPMMVPNQVSMPKRIGSSTSGTLSISRKPEHDKKIQSLTVIDADDGEDIDADIKTGSPKGFFSFYDAKEEERKLATISDTSVPNSLRLTDANQPRISGLSTTITHNECENQTLNDFPIPPVKPFEDSELPKPGDIHRPTGHGGESEAEFEPIWTEATFIPAIERKRARFGQLSTTAGPSSIISHLTAANSEVKSVNQDDLTAGAQRELIKSVTSGDRIHRPKLNLVDEPGKLAFRKHQITWLAYKAQEQEFELEEKWAEARRNQAQSRAKYGF